MAVGPNGTGPPSTGRCPAGLGAWLPSPRRALKSKLYQDACMLPEEATISPSLVILPYKKIQFEILKRFCPSAFPAAAEPTCPLRAAPPRGFQGRRRPASPRREARQDTPTHHEPPTAPTRLMVKVYRLRLRLGLVDGHMGAKRLRLNGLHPDVRGAAFPREWGLNRRSPPRARAVMIPGAAP